MVGRSTRACEVNWLIDGVGDKRVPTVDLAHDDLAAGRRPEQHRCGVGRRQQGLRPDPSFEFLVQPLGCVLRRRARNTRPALLQSALHRLRRAEVDLFADLMKKGYLPT